MIHLVLVSEPYASPTNHRTLNVCLFQTDLTVDGKVQCSPFQSDPGFDVEDFIAFELAVRDSFRDSVFYFSLTRDSQLLKKFSHVHIERFFIHYLILSLFSSSPTRPAMLSEHHASMA